MVGTRPKGVIISVGCLFEDPHQSKCQNRGFPGKASEANTLRLTVAQTVSWEGPFIVSAVCTHRVMVDVAT